MRSQLCCIRQIFSHVLGLGIKTDTEFNTEISTELFVSGTGKY